MGLLSFLDCFCLHASKINQKFNVYLRIRLAQLIYALYLHMALIDCGVQKAIAS
jgi:hypothetical protein